jgi:hypothetical protein
MMRQLMRRLISIVGLVSGLLLLGGRAQAVSPQFLTDCQALTRHPHRLTGSPEYKDAADYVAARLRALGVQDVLVQQFPTVELTVQECALRAGGQTLALVPMRPNGIIPATTPPAGITGELMLAGAGTPKDFGTQSPAGKIVVLNYDSRDGWLRAFRLGARAVVFVGEGGTAAWAHYSEAPANLPRYYFAGSIAQLARLTGQSATLSCTSTWRPAIGRNVIGILRGTQATFKPGLEKPEALLVSAPLDSYGEVPHISPGARGAANCAALLEMTGHWVANRPRRDLVIAFWDNQAHAHAGVAAFYSALETDVPLVSLKTRQRNWTTEDGSLRGIAASLEKEEAPFGVKGDALIGALRMLKDGAAEHVYELSARMEDTRRLLAKATEMDPATVARHQAQLTTDQAEKDGWNDIRKGLAHQNRRALYQPALQPQMRLLVKETRAKLEHRLVELTQEKAALATDTKLQKLIGATWISLHLSLALGDTTPRWGMIIGGDTLLHSASDVAGLYGKIQGTFLAAADELAAQGAPVVGFERATADTTLNTRLCWATSLVHSGEIAGRLGIYNLALGTIQESLPREGSPADRLANTNLDRIAAQGGEIARLVGAAGNAESLSVHRSIVPDKLYCYPELSSQGYKLGATVMGVTPGSSLPNKPMAGAIVQIHLKPLATLTWRARKIPAYDQFLILSTNARGVYKYGLVPTDTYNSNMRGFAVAFDPRGEPQMVSDTATVLTVQTRLNQFACMAPTIVDGEQRLTRRSGALVLAAQNELPVQAMQARTNGALDGSRSNAGTIDGLEYWYCERNVENIKAFGVQSIVALGSGEVTRQDDEIYETKAEKARVLGEGFSLLTPWEFHPSAMQSAADLWRLNQLRLLNLRSRGVMNSSLEELHGRADDLWMAAGLEQNIAKAEALAMSSFLTARPVYESLRRGLDDIVRAVLILLGLAIPFAFALERLLICSTNIYRQITWFALFFLATFGILYMVHPAFAISNQPVIIFLAFALVILSSLVIMVIMQKFEEELKVLQGLTATVHSADVSRVSTMMAAVGMGISTMRRRPLRTALTALTITLLTFTILNFASFDTRIGIVTLFDGPTPSYSGVLVHKTNWASLSADLVDICKGRWEEQATIATRYWLPAGVAGSEGPLVTRVDGTTPLTLQGLVGLEPAEVAARPDLRALLGEPAALTTGVVVTEALAQSLQVRQGEQLIIGGVPLTVARVVKASALSAVREMDDSGILPVDFAAMANSQANAPQGAQQKPVGSDVLASAQNALDWVELSPDTVVVVSAETARQLGASLRQITLYTTDATQATAIAEDLARVAALPVMATRTDGVYAHVLAPTVQAKGVQDLLFPLILGALVIFGTMLGSVADREKEIYTFSALGLAPAHVATLFFAEALVYACIGGMGGYLLAQGVMKVMMALARLGIVAVPEMNYSSLNAIVTILIVMLTVLVSAIYPAIKASRSANPGVMRAWRVPPPQGDEYHITFPFTVSAYDITGVASFLKEHFENFSDTSLGVFMAREVHIVRTDGRLGVQAQLALAPFDLGVTQTFHLKSAPSEIPGIDEVTIHLARLSGQRKDWERLNKVLLDDLRRQFLIWRSLPQQTMELYRQRTLEALDETVADASPTSTAPTPSVV